jgi:hypothetical protein
LLLEKTLGFFQNRRSFFGHKTVSFLNGFGTLSQFFGGVFPVSDTRRRQTFRRKNDLAVRLR